MSDAVPHSMRRVLDGELAEARELSLRMGEFVEDAIVASHDDRVDRIYRRLFDEEVHACAAGEEDAACATRLTLVAHHLERIADRVTNMGEDLVYLQTGNVEELG